MAPAKPVAPRAGITQNGMLCAPSVARAAQPLAARNRRSVAGGCRGNQPPDALLSVVAALWWMLPSALGRVRRFRAVGWLLGPAQRRQIAGHRPVGLIVVAGYLLACGDSPGGGLLAIGLCAWPIGTRVWLHGVAEPGHDGC